VFANTRLKCHDPVAKLQTPGEVLFEMHQRRVLLIRIKGDDADE
jgi:hypothetical protein